METRNMQNQFLIDKDRAYVWHPFRQAQTAHPPILIKRGRGSYLFDENGQSYLDGISSWWVNLHGHAHPYIVERIKAQLDVLEHVIFTDFTHAPAVELAARLISILPGNMSKIFYSDNGSTAVEAALKMALQYWHNKNIPKSTLICFKNSYHGETFGAMSAAGKNNFNRPFWKHLFEVKSIDPPFRGSEENSLKQLQAILEKNDTACFIYEPLILGTGGMIIYSSQGLSRLLECCKHNGVLTVADEVMTGFGRTGTLFASEQVNEKPDLICFSKGLTGGFLPLGATSCTNEIYNAFLSDHFQHAFLHGHSYMGNPLACSSALASLDLLLQEDYFNRRSKIENLHKQFCQKWQHHPKLKRCEHLGTILALEYLVNETSYFQPLRDTLYHFFLKKGIYLRPLGNVLYILPPYCITEEELQNIYTHIIFTLEHSL